MAYNRAGNPAKESQKEKTMITGAKAMLFKKMYLELHKKIGNRKDTIKFLSTSENTIERLYKGVVSYETAKKILNRYKQLNKET